MNSYEIGNSPPSAGSILVSLSLVAGSVAMMGKPDRSPRCLRHVPSPLWMILTSYILDIIPSSWTHSTNLQDEGGVLGQFLQEMGERQGACRTRVSTMSSLTATNCETWIDKIIVDHRTVPVR